VAKILVIDDDQAVREALRITLEGAGHIVLEAEGGQTGLRLGISEPFDLIITDLLMPDVDGLEVIREFQKSLPTVRILAISGGGKNTPATYLSVAGKLGADLTLAKPFGKTDLLQAVDELLKKA
jgi:CheY-like chemotaxis protein